jgi:hypothetical protein
LLDSPLFHSWDPFLNRTAFRERGRENVKMRNKEHTEVKEEMVWKIMRMDDKESEKINRAHDNICSVFMKCSLYELLKLESALFQN